jgi:hypothetical protein
LFEHLGQNKSGMTVRGSACATTLRALRHQEVLERARDGEKVTV